MGRGAGPARSLAPRAALGLLLALACSAAADTTQATQDVCPEPPTKEVVCYYEGSTPVSRLDACLCTSVVFTDVASKAGDGFAVDIGVRSQVRALRKRNPWVRALLQLQVGAAQLKSEERRQRASQAVSAALRKATVDGVELDLDWSRQGAANKTHLTAFVKAVRFQLDSADAVDRRRAKRDYEIFERSTKSVSTTEAFTAADTDADTIADTDMTESTEPTTSDTAADTAADTAGTVPDEEVTMTTERSKPTATTSRSSTRTSRASDLARQYAELDGDLADDDEEDDEPSRILLLQLPTKPELIAKYYDMRALSKQVDWFILSSHNLTDESERGLTFHHSRLMGLDDLLNTDSLVDLVTGLGAPKQQVIVSLPAFALRFTLQDETKDTPRSAAVGEPERLSQQQLCELMSEGGWSVERDQDLTAPYAFKNNSWIAFEDHMSVNIKAKYVLLRDLAGLAIQSVDEEDWLQKSCKPPVQDDEDEDEDDDKADKDDRSDESRAKARPDEGQVAGADGDDGSYHPEDKEHKQTDEKQKDAEGKKGDKKAKAKAEPMPMTLLETAFKGLTESARRSRAALLSSLEEDIHQHAVEYNDYTGSVQLSPYQIVRVVDREGTVHSVRRNARTEFECSRQGYFVHPLSCNRFYRCVKYNQYSSEYTVFEFDCPAGLAFDERVEVCVWPGSLPGGACKGSSEIAPVPRSQYGCPNAEGYYADPENCRWFFACLDHARDGLSPLTAYEFRCPFGLVFDEGRQVCNWPWLVEGCGGAGASALRYQGVRVSGAAAGSAVNYEGLSLLSAGVGAGYASGASLAGNTLYSGDAAAGAGAGYSADASFESASYAANGGASSGYAYNQAAGGAAGASASAGRYGENNGYIALQAAQDAGSRHEDRGYGGFATFPATQVSGGRSQGSSGVVLGANLYPLQGIQGVAVGQAGSAYQSHSAGASASAYDGQQTTGYSFGAGSSGAAAAAGSYDYNAGSSADFGAKQTVASAGYDYSAGSGSASTFGAKQTAYTAGSNYNAGSASTFGAKQTASTLGYDYSSGASSLGASGATASAGYDYNGASSLGVTGSSGSSYSAGLSTTSGIQHTTPGYSFGSTSSGSDYSSGADFTASTASSLGASSGASVQGAQSIQGVHVESDGSSGYSSAGAVLTPVTEVPFVKKTAYTVTPAPYDAVSYSQPAAVQTVTASPGVVSFQSVTPTASSVHSYKQFELQQPLVPVHASTPAAPSLVRYQTVFGLKQQQQQQQVVTAAPALAPASPTLYTYKQYEVKQPVVHFQSVTPTAAPAVVSVQSYTPTAAPALVSVTPAVATAVQPVTPAPAYSFIRKQTPAPTPAPALAFVTPSAAPAVVGYAQQQHVQHEVHAVTPGSVDHSVQYQYSSPAPFSLKDVKYHRIVDIQQEPNGYYQAGYKNYNQQQHAQVHTYQQEVKQVQPVVPVVQYQQEVKQVQQAVPVVQYQQVKKVQPVVPVTKVEYQAPAVQYQQHAQVHTYQQELKQEQPVVHYQQEYKQVQPVVPVVQYQQEVKQVQPVTKVEYQTPTVQYQQHAQVHSYQQQVEQVQPVAPVVQYQQVKQVQPVVPVTQYQQEIKQVQTTVPVTKVEYQAPAVQYQQHAQVHSYQQQVKQVQPVVQYQQVKQVQPVVPVTKVEYQVPAVQYQQYQQEVKQVQPLTKFEYKTPAFQYQNLQNYKEYKQEVQQVQPVTPAAVTKFEYHAPAQVHTYQQQVKQVQPVVQYQQEVKQVQPISKFEYQAPAVQYQQYQQVKQVQPVVQYQQEVKQVQPIAKVEYQAPAVQYQQHAQVHSYQQEVKQVQPVTQVKYEAPAVQYQEVKQVQPVVEYRQQVKQVQPVVPVTKVEYQAPAVQYQQHAQVHSYQQEVQQVQPVVQYQQEVSQVQPVTKFEYKAPAVQVQQQVQYQQPAVAVKAQEVVYSYSTPSSYPIRQEAVKAVQLNLNQAVSHRPKLYPFVSSTTAAPALSELPLLHSYTYVNGKEPSTPVPCTTCSHSTAGLRVSSTPAPVRYTEQQQQYVYSSTPAPAPAPARYTEQQYVYSTPAPVRYTEQQQQYAYSSTPAPARYTEEQKQQYVYSTPEPVRYTEKQVVYSSTPAPARYTEQQQQYVYSTPAPARYTEKQVVYSSTPAPARYTEEQKQQYVYSTPAPVRYTEQQQQYAYSSTPAPACTTCSQSSAGLKVSSTPSAFQFNYVSSTPKYEAGVVSQVNEQQTNHYSGYQIEQQQQQQLTQVDDQEPPVALFVQTAAPPPARYNQVLVSSTPAPARYSEQQQVVVSSTPAPEVYSQQYYSTPAPVSVVKNVVTQVSTPATYVEQGVQDVQSIEFGAKKSNVVSEYSYVQGQEQAIPTAAPAVDVYPIAPEAPATVDVEYQTPATPVRRLRPSTTAAAYVEEQQQQQFVSEGYAGDVVVSTTAAPAGGSTRGHIRYGYEEELQQQINAEEAIEDGAYGVKSEDAYSGLAQAIETSTLAAIGAAGGRRPGRVRVGTTALYSEGGAEGFSSTTESYGSSTVRAKGKGRKRTKIVVVTRLSDVNPLLIGKLGAQCSCAENAARHRRPGVKRVISRVRVVRPKDGDAAGVVSSTAGYASSSTEGYVSSTTEGRVVSSTEQAEIDEDLALIRDAEKSDAEEGDDDAADFGAVVVSSTESTVSSSAAYDQDELVSSTVSSRGRSRARGRTTYVRAGKIKSTIYVSTTAEPDDDDDEQSPSSSTSSRVYEVTTPTSRRFSGRRTTARSIQINSKDDEDDAEAVVIKPRQRSRARPSPRVRSRARSDNDLAQASPSPAPAATEVEDTNTVDEATPGPGHTVDLGVNGIVECKRPGLFRHPELCNKFYSCNWDKWKKKYAVNVFNCPIHLAYDTTIGACNWPSKGPACVNGKLLV